MLLKKRQHIWSILKIHTRTPTGQVGEKAVEEETGKYKLTRRKVILAKKTSSTSLRRKTGSAGCRERSEENWEERFKKEEIENCDVLKNKEKE